MGLHPCLMLGPPPLSRNAQVAIKRCNILLSVLAGGFFFRESVLSRLPCIVLMLSGVAMIVLEPNTADLHAHHT